ncbi:MAG: RsmD family RNA methyltransferase [Bacteroidaceae bacterium]|nr:RsmD family RNA methyltransferase [Bacteroidaceae bacterium]
MNKETKEYILAHADDDVRTLALSKMPEAVDSAFALRQIESRQKALRKLPTWHSTEGIIWPKRLSMEQCSSEETAAYKSRLIQRIKEEADVFIDLTGGFGVDFASIARNFRHSIYVERDTDLCDIAKNNFPLLGVEGFRVWNESAETAIERLPESARNRTVVFLDPARRDGVGRKTVLIEDCTPNILALQHRLLTIAKAYVVKLSPMLDITAAIKAVEGVAEAHVVSGSGECKEVLLVVDGCKGEAAIHCCGLQFSQSQERQAQPEYATQLRAWLYEPDAAILKAGMTKSVALRFGVEKLSPISHLYTSDKIIESWPGKCFPISGMSGFNKKELRRMLQGITNADITVRGFPETTATLRKRLRLREGGPVHLFAATMADGRHILIKSLSE